MQSENEDPEVGAGNRKSTVLTQDHSVPVSSAATSLPQTGAAEEQNGDIHAGTRQAPAENPAPASKPEKTVVFDVNLFLLIASGTWLCVWLLYYTDKFDDFAKVLALGGGLTWLAFVLKVLSEERLKKLQGDLDRLVFSRWWLTIVLLVSFGVGLYCRSHYGTLQVELFQGNEDRILTVKVADMPLEPWRLTPGGKVRIPVWTSSDKPAPLYVKVSGYPDLRVRIAPRERRELRIPASFTRRVILLRPTPQLIAYRTNGLSVRVRLNGTVLSGEDGKQVTDLTFDGRPVWIGADQDVFIPQSMLDRWRDSLPGSIRSEAMSFLQHAVAVTTTGFELKSGDRVCVEFLHGNGSLYLRRVINVRPMEPNRDFPQEEEIDVPTTQTSPPNC